MDAAAPDLFTLLEAVQQPMVVIGADTRIAATNSRFHDLVGLPPAELLGRACFDIVHPDDRFDAYGAFSALLGGAAQERVVVRTTHASGAYVPMRIEAQVAPLRSGPTVVASLRLLTPQHVGHDPVLEAYEYLRAAVDELDTAVVATDTDGCVLFANQTFANFHGTPPSHTPAEEWLSPHRFFDRDGAALLEIRETPLLRTLRGERVAGFEFMMRSRTGDLRHHRANGRRLIGTDGRPCGAVLALHDITEQRKAEASLHHLSLHDTLTGLANRTLLLDRISTAIERARRDAASVCVITIDLDHFKVVNDGIGHHVGDQVLLEVTRRIQALTRATDTVARVGGDEFAVLVEDLESTTVALDLAQRLRDACREPFTIDGGQHRTTASIGFTIGQGDGLTAAQLLREADTALYRAKDRGRDRVEPFHQEMERSARRRVDDQHRLAHALDNGHLRVLYQPLVTATDRRLVGVEALVRLWDERTDSLIGPADFIPIAETTGMIGAIDEWVLREATAQTVRWLAAAGRELPFSITCNLSAASVARVDLADLVADACRVAGLHPSRLGLELTEHSLIEASAATRTALDRVRAAGVRIGIDDFGTGFSSLTYLRDFPVSFLKIDRTFVQGLGTDRDDTAIVEAVIALAHALGLRVVAEGVEQENQAVHLARVGCDALQGFLLGRPVGAEVIAARLRPAGWAAFVPTPLG